MVICTLSFWERGSHFIIIKVLFPFSLPTNSKTNPYFEGLNNEVSIKTSKVSDKLTPDESVPKSVTETQICCNSTLSEHVEDTLQSLHLHNTEHT